MTNTIVYITHKLTKITEIYFINHDDTSTVVQDALTLAYNDEAPRIALELQQTKYKHILESLEHKVEWYLTKDSIKIARFKRA